MSTLEYAILTYHRNYAKLYPWGAKFADGRAVLEKMALVMTVRHVSPQ